MTDILLAAIFPFLCVAFAFVALCFYGLISFSIRKRFIGFDDMVLERKKERNGRKCC